MLVVPNQRKESTFESDSVNLLSRFSVITPFILNLLVFLIIFWHLTKNHNKPHQLRYALITNWMFEGSVPYVMLLCNRD